MTKLLETKNKAAEKNQGRNLKALKNRYIYIWYYIHDKQHKTSYREQIKLFIQKS